MQQTSAQARKATEVELRALLSSTQDLLDSVGESAGEEVDAVKAKLQATIARIHGKLGDSLDSATTAGRRPRRFVSERPWTALGIGAALGAGIGLAVFAGRLRSRRTGWTSYFTR